MKGKGPRIIGYVVLLRSQIEESFEACGAPDHEKHRRRYQRRVFRTLYSILNLHKIIVAVIQHGWAKCNSQPAATPVEDDNSSWYDGNEKPIVTCWKPNRISLFLGKSMNALCLLSGLCMRHVPATLNAYWETATSFAASSGTASPLP